MNERGQQVERIVEAMGGLESEVEFDRAVATLASWCSTFVRQYEAAESDSDIPLAFLGWLGTSSGVPNETVHAIRGGLKDGLHACLGRSDHEWRDVSAVVLGRAASGALVQELRTADLRADTLVPRLFQLCGVDSLAHEALTAALAEALRQDEAARTAMLVHLGECVDNIDRNPGKFVYESDRGPFDSFVREWRGNPSIADLWRGSGQQFIPIFDLLDFVDAALGAAPAEVLQILDRWRFPHPLDWILTRNSICHDRDRIAELIQLAPSSIEGGTWNGSILALLILKEADNYCRDLWHAAQRNEADLEGTQELLYSWLKDVAAIVARRDDGTFLSAHWLLMKSLDERFERRSSGENSLLPQLEMIGWIGNSLVQAGLGGRDIDEASSRWRNDDAGGLDVLASMAMLDRLGSNTVLDSQALLSRLDDLLVSRDPCFRVESTFDVGVVGFADSSIGYLLAMEGCADRWKRSWDLLTEQRRMVVHWQHTKDSDALAPSLFLVRVGLAALDWLCSESPGRRHVAGALWQTMFDAVRECWLTISVVHLAEFIERDIGRLFGRHPAVFGIATAGLDSNGTYGQRLADDLAVLGGDDMLMARCCELVSRNLHDQAHLHCALRCNDGQGRAVLGQFLRWQEVERHGRRQPHLHQAIKKLLAGME